MQDVRLHLMILQMRLVFEWREFVMPCWLYNSDDDGTEDEDQDEDDVSDSDQVVTV